MSISQPQEPREATPRKTLRVWPGIVAVALQWISRFGVKALVPGLQGFGWAVLGSLFFALVIIVWWAFFSRARPLERLGAGNSAEERTRFHEQRYTRQAVRRRSE